MTGIAKNTIVKLLEEIGYACTDYHHHHVRNVCVRRSQCDEMEDCAARIIGRPQITTDSHRPYLAAVEKAFGGDADYAMLHKIIRDVWRAGDALHPCYVHRVRHEDD